MVSQQLKSRLQIRTSSLLTRRPPPSESERQIIEKLKLPNTNPTDMSPLFVSFSYFIFVTPPDEKNYQQLESCGIFNGI